MRYSLSLAGDTFTPVVEDFDQRLSGMLRRMLEQHMDEGCVTLKLTVELQPCYPMDADGEMHELVQPVFHHEVTAQTVQKQKDSGKIAEDFVLRTGRDGQTELVSRDTFNLFDMVEEAERRAGRREGGERKDGDEGKAADG